MFAWLAAGLFVAPLAGCTSYEIVLPSASEQIDVVERASGCFHAEGFAYPEPYGVVPVSVPRNLDFEVIEDLDAPLDTCAFPYRVRGDGSGQWEDFAAYSTYVHVDDPRLPPERRYVRACDPTGQFPGGHYGATVRVRISDATRPSVLEIQGVLDLGGIFTVGNGSTWAQPPDPFRSMQVIASPSSGPYNLAITGLSNWRSREVWSDLRVSTGPPTGWGTLPVYEMTVTRLPDETCPVADP